MLALAQPRLEQGLDGALHHPHLKKKKNKTVNRAYPAEGSRARRAAGRGARPSVEATGLRNPGEAGTIAQFVPRFEQGKPIGFAIFRIQPGSPYTQIGLQNGDVIRRINGLDTTSVDNLFEIYSRLPQWSQVDVEIERAGATVKKTFRID